MSGARTFPARDRAAVISGGALLAVAATAWGVLLFQAQMPMLEGGIGEGLTFLAAWAVMMAAMMLPSAVPMISLYGVLQRNAAPSTPAGIPTWLFALVYLLMWIAFGVPVYLVSIVVGSHMALADVQAYAVAAVLVVAGAYQLTPLKRACLRACRSPLGFLMARDRTGYRATVRLALEHAAYCIGCCWALMVVLVAAGAMSLPWVLLIAVVVSVEKLLPGGTWTARMVAAGLIAIGVAVAVNPDVALLLRPSSGME